MQPILEIRPVFITNQALLKSISPLFIFFFLMGVCVFYVILEATNTDYTFFYMNIYIVVSFILPIIINFHRTKHTYANTYYKFFSNKIVYRETLANTAEKEFFYDKIVETSLKRDIIQQFFGTGSITLRTYSAGNNHHAWTHTLNSMCVNAMQSAGELHLQDLDYPDNTYAVVKKILAQSKKTSKHTP